MPLLHRGPSAPKKVPHPVYLSPVRRIQRVATGEKLCAMTFSDGPCRMPACPDHFRGKPLTLVLAETLERYGARGTFHVVGDTSENYPDRAGKSGSPTWSGVSYDHCPDFDRDDQGGAANCPELVTRLLAGGHEISSHSYTHRLFGWTPVGYRRKSFRDLEAVTADLERLHAAVKKGWGYPIRLAQPPHFADGIRGGFSSFDAFALMGYQYVSASFDGAGRTAHATYQAEVAAMWRPMEKILLEDPGYFRGQIILHRDGPSFTRRTPVADGLAHQLQLLTDHGYRVVTVSELLDRSPFQDVPPDAPVGRAARRLLGLGMCVAFQDNTLRPDAPLTRGELAMMAFGNETARRRIDLVRSGRAPFRDMAPRHPYAAAAVMAAETRTISVENGRFRPDDLVTAEDLRQFCSARLGRTPPERDRGELTHGQFFLLINALLDSGNL